MVENQTPRFRKYKLRKRDNWTAQTMAYKMVGQIMWPAVGLVAAVMIIIFGLYADFDFGKLLLLLSLFVFPGIILTIVDEGRGFGVFVGWMFWRLPGNSKAIRAKILALAQQKLSISDQELQDTYVRTRPESSR